MSELGRTIRVLRATRDLTQRDVADAAGLSAAFISQVESGQKQPSIATLERIADALGTSVASLVAQQTQIGLPRRFPTRLPPMEKPRNPTVPIPHDSGSHFGLSRHNAETILRDRHAARRLVEEVREKAVRGDAWRLGDVSKDLSLLTDALELYIEGRYRSFTAENMVLVAAALLYFVSPADIVPDYLEEGYLDDAAILAFIAEMVGPDLDALSAWLVSGGVSHPEVSPSA
jgi:transcriptional regulator with XRE-family HTH domain